MTHTTGWPKALGGSWLREDRPAYAHRYASRELLYAHDCASSPNGFTEPEARARVNALLNRGDVDVYLRVDFSQFQSLPSTPDEINCFVTFMGGVARDATLSRVKGYIIGNEPNLAGFTPYHVARVVYGAPGDANNVYNAVRQWNSSALVVLPAVGPWNTVTDGDLPNCRPGNEGGCAIPPGRSTLTPWERYMYSLAYRAFNDSNAPQDQVMFSLHTYSRLDKALKRGLPKNAEPNQGIRDWDVGEGSTGAYVNSWVYDDFRYQIMQARPNKLMPWHIIGEWNTLWDYNNDQGLSADEWPSGAPAGYSEGTGAYPGGLFGNLIMNYLRYRDQLLAVLNFVDNDLGGCTWAKTAMRNAQGCGLDATQTSRLAA